MILVGTLLCAFSLASGLELTIGSSGGNKSSPLLYGLLFEVRKSEVDAIPQN